MIEIRNFGDGKTVVAYTNERNVASKLQGYKDCFRVVPYEQEQFTKKKIGLVGVDYYFPKKKLKSLLRAFKSAEFQA